MISHYGGVPRNLMLTQYRHLKTITLKHSSRTMIYQHETLKYSTETNVSNMFETTLNSMPKDVIADYNNTPTNWKTNYSIPKTTHEH